jgi:RNA-directed DNA polymerase
VNTGAPWPDAVQAGARVLEIQTKLHRWARADADRRFDDLFNLVADPAFLVVAWTRVRGNTGSRSAGVDGETAREIEQRGAEAFLNDLRAHLRARTFKPLPVRERMIPKPGTTKKRRLGIPTVADRVVQASLKLVLEPIFETDFQPCSYGFRPRRRAQDAIEEIRFYASRSYEWVLEADIEACFDAIDHTALLQRVRRRIGDKRVLALVKAFLHAGVLSEDQVSRATHTGTPQGGILSPLLANIALSLLDDYAAEHWQTMGDATQRYRHRLRGGATWRLVRYADDFVVLVSGTREHAEELRGDIAGLLAPMGLRLSEAKTCVVHIDKGFDFLGFRIKRDQQHGSNRHFIYTYPAKKALASIKRKVKSATTQGYNRTLASLLQQLSLQLRGWTQYFRHSSASATYGYLRHYTWWRVVHWLRRKHPKMNWKTLRRRYLRVAGKTWAADEGVELFDATTVAITRYRYRGAQIPTPWTEEPRTAPRLTA